MAVDSKKVGDQIQRLRKIKGMTQGDLGETLRVSFQAVSKWERGETLPDVAILPELADALGTTVDYLLSGGEGKTLYKGKMTAQDMMEGVRCLARIGLLWGRHNVLYRYLIEGISQRMNSDIEGMLEDDFLRECLAAEAIIQNIKAGYAFDIAEVKRCFAHERWFHVVSEHAKKHGQWA